MNQNAKKKMFILFLVIIVIIIAIIFFYYINHKVYKYNQDDFDKYVNILKKIDYKIPKKNFKIPMYYINLEKSKDRNDAMLKQKKEFNLPLERVEAVNGYELESTKNDSFFIKPSQKINFINLFSETENFKATIGCTLSHIKAIHTALENDDKLAIIMEDDTSLITYNHWSKKIKKIIKKAPPSWRIINLYHFCQNKISNTFISNMENTCASASCYIINNKGMRELIDLVKINNSIVLKKTKKAKHPDVDVLAADFFLFNLVETYHYNGKILIFPNIKLQSTIHVEHYEVQLDNVLKKINKFLLKKKYINLPVDYNNVILSGAVQPGQSINEQTTTIPKILSQTYHSPNKIPEKVLSNVKKFAPDYKVVIYDDNQGEDFIKQYYTDKVVDRYKKLTGAHKADLLRYCILYINGGVYADIKTEFIVPLSSLFKNSAGSKPLIYFVNAFDSLIYNGVIATPKKQKIFLDAINFIVQKSILLPEQDYLCYVKDLFDKVSTDLYIKNLQPGFNEGHNNNYFFYEEIITFNASDCYDGLDQHGFCSWIYDNNTRPNRRVIKTRYSDYPW